MKRFILFVLVVLLVAVAPPPAVAAPPQFKVRALWVDTSGFATPGAVDLLIAKCQRAGINVILPNVLCHGAAFYKSPHFAGHMIANRRFDPLECLLAKAHAAHIQVQAWCCVYYEGAEKPLHPGWLNRSFDGKAPEQDFLSAANPEVNAYLLPVLTDLLAYDIDGIHLDYIRYPGTVYDYSDPARKAFAASAGFDPIHFLDHPEKIVPAEKDLFPVRALHARRHIDRTWETSGIERTLDATGVGFAFVSETPTGIDALRVPGLLVLSSYYEVSREMTLALERYVQRGGNILWSDTPALRENTRLQRLLGLTNGQWTGSHRMSLRPVGEHPLARLVPTNGFTASANVPALTGATVIATLDTGEPAVTCKKTGKGRVVTLGFDAMNATGGTGSLVRGIVDWLRRQSGVEGPDLLAAKRAQWADWRAAQVTSLVRGVSQAVKAKSPKLVVTSSGGPNPVERFNCYRDARGWLAEGLNDHVFPMNYTVDSLALADMLQEQAQATPPGKLGCVYPGLQIYRTEKAGGKSMIVPVAAGVLEEQLRVVQRQGHEGFCLFAYCYLSDEIIETLRKTGQ